MITRIKNDHNMETFNFIAHRLDQVIVGKIDKNVSEGEEIRNQLKEEWLLELHIFNEKKEVFYRRINGGLKPYKVLEHEKILQEQDTRNKVVKIIDRNYILEKQFQREKQYNMLSIREYIKLDQDSHLPYVDKTVLLDLIYDENVKGGLK
ncbi:hypothetical protein [Inediibacterium massiliense]|uniref:hypothetical protein n=1 Tax=Inediibacterium massiliense TaxID=1658111 RepID=UPI0006B43EB7|nr:hypothetical protein [Inediibacterium massiliense]